jgi:hypothetical protein
MLSGHIRIELRQTIVTSDVTDWHVVKQFCSLSLVEPAAFQPDLHRVQFHLTDDALESQNESIVGFIGIEESVFVGNERAKDGAAACMVYVDLNPIRAGIAKTPEASDFTSVKERVADRQSASDVSSADAQDVRIEHGKNAGWLAPVPLEPPRKKVREKTSSRRASNKGCLAMSLDQYLQLLDWTGRQLRTDKRGSIPRGLDPIMDRLQCSSESWLDLVKNFRNRFRVEIGLPTALQSVSSLRRSHRFAARE